MSTGGDLQRTLAGTRSLVLGGTGLIGSSVVRSLLAAGSEVRVATRNRGSGAPALDGLTIDIVEADISRAETIGPALEGVDILFHCAAPYTTRQYGAIGQVRQHLEDNERLLSVMRSFVPRDLLAYRLSHAKQVAIEQAEMAAQVARVQPDRSEEILRSVRDASLARDALEGRLDASLHPPFRDCRTLSGLKRIVYTSSVTTIGRPRGSEPGAPARRLATEADRYAQAPDPSPYFALKRRLEAAYTRSANEGVPVVITNPTLVVDEGDAHLTTGRLLVNVARGRMPFYIPGSADIVGGRDVGIGHVLAATRGRTGQRYILSSERMLLRDFLCAAAEDAGARTPWIPVPFPLAEVLSRISEFAAYLTGSPWPAIPMHGLQMLRHTPAVSSQRARSELDWTPTPVRDALRRAIAWYRNYGWI